jgi:hypothetical protein
MPAGSGHPEPAANVSHVPKRDQLGAMFGGDYRWRLSYSAQIVNDKKRDKFFAGEQFRLECHHLSIASSDDRSVVNRAHINE